MKSTFISIQYWSIDYKLKYRSFRHNVNVVNWQQGCNTLGRIVIDWRVKWSHQPCYGFVNSRHDFSFTMSYPLRITQPLIEIILLVTNRNVIRLIKMRNRSALSFKIKIAKMAKNGSGGISSNSDERRLYIRAYKKARHIWEQFKINCETKTLIKMWPEFMNGFLRSYILF